MNAGEKIVAASVANNGHPFSGGSDFFQGGGFLLHARNFRILDINAGGLRIDGRSREEIVGRTHWEVWPDTEQAELGELMKRVMTSREAGSMEVRYARPDGRLGVFDINIYPVAEGIVVFYSDITQRNAVEQALAESEERLRLATEHAEIGFWDVDPVNDILIWPPRVKAMFGISPDVPVSMLDFYNGLHPDDQEKTSEAYAGAADPARRAIYDVEYRTIGKEDGRLRWVAAKGRGVFDDAGRCIRVVGTAIDITRRKEAEQALASQLQLTKAITDNATSALFIMDDKQQCTFMNPAAEKLTGYRLDDVKGRPLHDAIHHTHPDGTPYPRSECPIDRALPENNQEQGEEVFVHKDGRFYTVAFTASPLREKGETRGTVIEVRDITREKKAEQELRESEDRFRTMANNIPQLAWMTDATGWIFWYNRRWYDYTGTTLEEMQGWGWQKVHHPAHMQRVTDRFKLHLETGAEGWEDNFPLRSKDGEYRWFLSRAYPIRDDKGDIIRWFGTNTDITEQREIEAELRRANADLEQFAYSASHDLQEPLRSVSIYSELLDKRYRDRLDGQALEFLDFLRSGAGRMEKLIHDLLSYSQVLKIEVPDEEADAGEALNTSLANLSEAIATTNAKVTSDALPRLRVHRLHLNQLFQNLIGNAIKYRRPDVAPLVHVSAERERDGWVFSVSDNGIGIDTQYKERIFGLFKRLHTGDEYSGTGIGLAICQRIVERYHGRIWVESPRGQGSTFRFTLPA
jgi:PAS domain S-box-containing protein